MGEDTVSCDRYRKRRKPQLASLRSWRNAPTATWNALHATDDGIYMRDIVLFLVFGAYVWAAAVAAFISLYVYAGDSVVRVELSDQDACARLEWLQSRNAHLIAEGI
jgi:hypothetical protein